MDSFFFKASEKQNIYSKKNKCLQHKAPEERHILSLQKNMSLLWSFIHF